MNKNSYRGKKRQIAITTIKKELNLPTNATPREKMQAVAAYNANHPEYSTRMICEAANVRHTTYLGFLAVGQNGNNGRQAHREDLESAIRKFAATLTSDPSVRETVKELRSQGFTCSPAIVSDILNEMGYVTSIWNTNALDRFIEKLNTSR